MGVNRCLQSDLTLRSMAFSIVTGRLIGLQVPHQPLKGFLIGIMVFPVGVIPDVPGTSEFGRPCFVCIHNSRIQTYWKQYCLSPLPFLFICSLDLILNPITVDGMLRQDQKELVMNANGLIDSISYLVTDLHVFWGKPTTDPFIMDVSVNIFCKKLKCSRLAKL